ncbi:MAG TPA: aminoglycoside adenylyltransferase domain-containing protein [Acidimicrobiales bacterium]|nr:aminoglycoside adenylyltransferase domain-containing protein [Acidimicrobiales bacterium]
MVRRLYRSQLARTARSLPWRWPLEANGVYVRWSDLGRPPQQVDPIASHVAGRFLRAAGFDVNPVTWMTLATSGVAVRGAAPSDLNIYHGDYQLRRWTVQNLNSYWARWAEVVRRPTIEALRCSMRHLALPWGVLGAPRLHYTIATGEIVSKELAGEYALDTFDRAWHPLIRDALAYWREPSAKGAFTCAPGQLRTSGEFVAMVVESGNRLWATLQ